MKCPLCQSENPDSSRFCGQCAAPLQAGPPSASSPSASVTTPLPSAGLRTVTSRVACAEIVPGVEFAGRYRIVDELGRGGMGRVYKALDREIGEAVALKVLGPGFGADQKMIERFRNELKLARRISHKNVCRIFDLGQCEGTHFITMEYVPGEDLKSMVQMMGPLAPPRALAVAGQVCDGLAEAHRLGIVHRDLKSSNIMIDREGSARIMDFGIARAAETKGLTDHGALVGTPEYMAPEQVEGKDVDPRSDIYSLGVILFEMATGKVPFEGKTPLSVALMHRDVKPPDPRALNKQTPDSMSGIIARCLQKNPGSRYQRIEELAAELNGVAEALADDGPAKAFRPSRGGLTPGGTRGLDSIAVLPFADLSPEKDQAYFCEGLAEELITALARVRRLEVAARSSAFSPGLQTLDVREVGRRLGVAAVLEGAVRKVGSKLRITVELLNVGTGYQIWSERYERTLEDVFAIQDEIALAVVDRLKVRLLGEEREALLKRPTANPEAYSLYLMGRFFWNKRNAEGIKRGLECFVRAIQLDPAFARAYTGISDCYGIFAYYWAPPRPTLTKGREAAAKALELDPTLAEAHTSMAFVKHKLERDWRGAEREFRQAIELDPDYLWAHHWYALYLAAMGRHQESFVEIKRALEIDPTSAQLHMVHGMLFYLARFYDRAVEELGKAVELDPHHVLATFYLGLSQLECGRYDEALTLVSRAADMNANAGFFVQGIGYVHASGGRGDLARDILARVDEIKPRTYISPVYQAFIYLRLGEPDKAFEWFDKALAEGDHWLEFIKVWPGVDPVRTDPRYAALVEKLGLQEAGRV